MLQKTMLLSKISIENQVIYKDYPRGDLSYDRLNGISVETITKAMLITTSTVRIMTRGVTIKDDTLISITSTTVIY